MLACLIICDDGLKFSQHNHLFSILFLLILRLRFGYFPRDGYTYKHNNKHFLYGTTKRKIELWGKFTRQDHYERVALIMTLLPFYTFAIL